MKFKLFCILAILFSINCNAEGQYGLGTFIFLTYLFCICVYTLILGYIVKAIFEAFHFKKNLNLFSYLTAFIVSLVLALIFEDDFIFFL